MNVATAVRQTMPLVANARDGATPSQKGSDLLGIVVHELRQPLTVIRGQLQRGRLLIGRDEARQRESIDVAIAQVDRMDKLLAALLDAETFVGQGLGVSIQTFDLAPTVTAAIARHQAGTVRSITLRSPRGAVLVRADPERTAEILDNLLANACRYSAANAPVEVAVTASGDATRIRVIDRGVGVPVEEQVRLFTPFYRASTARDIPGTGLGLHLSKRFAERLGGRLWLEASSPAGSTFALQLPSAAD